METEERLDRLERAAKDASRYEQIERRLALLETRAVTWKSVAWIAIVFAGLEAWHAWKR